MVGGVPSVGPHAIGSHGGSMRGSHQVWTSSDQVPVVPPSMGAPLALCFFLGLAFIERVKARCKLASGSCRKSESGACAP